MSRIMLDIPDDTLLALKLSPEGMGEALRCLDARGHFLTLRSTNRDFLAYGFVSPSPSL
jgi:hypothetical protein